MQVPEEIKAIFIDVIAQTADAFFRDEMESRGLITNEVRELSPNPRLAAQGDFVETKPKRERVQGYFDALDWNDREKVGKMMAVVNLHFRKLDPHLPPGFYDNVMRVLAEHGLRFDGERVTRTTSDAE